MVKPIESNKYSHIFALSFSVLTDKSCETDADYPSPDLIKKSILLRLASMNDSDLMEAVGAPLDTEEVDSEMLGEFDLARNIVIEGASS